jgi:hypothetical protein
MESDSVKPKCQFGAVYAAVFLSREDRIHGPKVPMHVQGLQWFTDSSGTEQETDTGINGCKLRLFSSPGREICKEGS